MRCINFCDKNTNALNFAMINYIDRVYAKELIIIIIIIRCVVCWNLLQKIL